MTTTETVGLCVFLVLQLVIDFRIAMRIRELRRVVDSLYATVETDRWLR